MSRQEEELDAAEYVIGTWSAVERRAFDDLMDSDAQTREDVWYWERVFGALNASVSPVAPPVSLWEKIRNSLPDVEQHRQVRQSKPTTVSPKLVSLFPGTHPKPPRGDAKKKVSLEPVNENPALPAQGGVGAADTVRPERTENTLKGSKSTVDETRAEATKPRLVATETVVKQPEVIEEQPEIIQSDTSEEVEKAKDLTERRERVETVVTDRSGGVSRWWRRLAILATVIALGLGAYIYSLFGGGVIKKASEVVEQTVAPEAAPDATPGSTIPATASSNSLLAVVNAEGNQPSLVVQVDGETGAVTLKGIDIVVPVGKSLQLWHSPKGKKRVSVGILGRGAGDFKLQSASGDDLLEVSVEPEEGAPGDQPSGAIVYSGRLVEVGQ